MTKQQAKNYRQIWCIQQKSQRKCHKNPNSMMNSANKYLRQSKSTLLNTYNQLRKTFRRTPLKSGIACHFTGWLYAQLRLH